jgi:hypothetical protein
VVLSKKIRWNLQIDGRSEAKLKLGKAEIEFHMKTRAGIEYLENSRA